MKRTKANNPIAPSSTSGLSMVLVIVMLMVFFILGGSVLTAASTTTAAASRRTAQRQAYLYARSTLDAVDESLRKGALGELLREDMLERMLAEPAREAVSYTAALRPNLTLSGSDSLGGVTFAGEGTDPGVEIVYTGRATVQVREGETPTKVAVRLQNLLLTLRVTYQEQTYTMRVQYRYAGWATKEGAVWTWSEGGWTVQQIG